MSGQETTPETGADETIPLRFEMNAQELDAIARQMLRQRRIAWISVFRKLAAFGLGYLAVDFAIRGQWIIAVLTAWLAVSIWSEHMLWLWLMRALFGRMTTQAELELDSAGTRGEFHCRSGWSWGNDDRRVDYAWTRLRKVGRLPDYLIFEFHGGSQLIIPIRVFASTADLEQCEAWADAGLQAQHLRKTAAPAPA